MSYSINGVRAATKAALMLALAAAFDAQVTPQQPVHKHDRDVHLANVERQLTVLPDTLPEGHEYTASMSGYLSWSSLDADGQPDPASFTSAGFGGGVGISAIPKSQTA